MPSLEEIRRKYNNDSLHSSLVPYVQPLLRRIAELEKQLSEERLKQLEDITDA